MANGNILLSTAIREYNYHMVGKRCSEVTIRNVNILLSRFLREMGDMQLKNLTPKHLECWFGPKHLMAPHKTAHRHYYRVNQPISDATHNQYRARLKAFFDWCMREGYLRHDPLRDVHPVKVVPRKRLRPSPAALVGLLDGARDALDRAYIATAINTALRASEIVRIRVGDVHLDQHEIAVLIKKTGERDNQPITEELDKELRRWLTAYANAIEVPLQPYHALFPRRSGNMIASWQDGVMIRSGYTYHPEDALDVRNTANMIRRAAEGSGLVLEKGDATHMIRRAVARAYFDMKSQEVGVSWALRETSTLLHHRLESTTERYLGHDLDKERRDRTLKGKPFLSTLLPPDDNVLPLRRKRKDA